MQSVELSAILQGYCLRGIPVIRSVLAFSFEAAVSGKLCTESGSVVGGGHSSINPGDVATAPQLSSLLISRVKTAKLRIVILISSAYLVLVDNIIDSLSRNWWHR